MEREVYESFLRRFKKKNTYIAYKTELSGFYDYLINVMNFKFETDEEMFRSINIKDVEKYFYYIDDKDYKKSTINKKLEVVREFLDYVCKRRHITEYNLGDVLEKYKDEEVKEDAEEKYVPTKNEILRLIEYTYEKKLDGRGRDYLSARNRFYIALMSTTGLRADEALGSSIYDIESVDGGYMLNIHKSRVKNSMNKRVPIPASIIKYFEEYKVQRMIANEKFNTDLLFFSSRGNKINSDNMNKELTELCERANIKGKITNHCFRHFLTQYLRKNGVDTSMIYKILGWKESGIDKNYDRNLDMTIYDEIKLKVCDVFR